MKKKIIDWFKELIKPKIKIVDVILHKNKYYTQRFVVLNKLPVFFYETRGYWLIAEDSGFYRFYQQRPVDPTCKAFAGRKFIIPLKNGEIIEADGMYWDNVPEKFKDIFQGGFAIADELNKCNVFCSYYYNGVIEQKINKWLKRYNASNNYYKYDKKSKDYMKQIIVSRFA